MCVYSHRLTIDFFMIMTKVIEKTKKSKEIPRSGVTRSLNANVKSVNEVAVKYNGKLNYKYKIPKVTQNVSNQNFVIVLDWLEIHHKSNLYKANFEDDIFTSKNVRIELVDRPTNNFKLFGNVYVKGKKLGVLRFQPRNSTSYELESSSLKIENELFYTGNWSDLLKVYEKETGSVYNNITRLDIALDVPCDRVFKFVETYIDTPLKKRKVRQLGRTKIHTINNPISNKSEKRLRQFKLGVPSKKSRVNKIFSGYNKSLELSENNHKDYISRFHKVNFGKGHNEVYRYEFRYSSRAIRELYIKGNSVSFCTGEISEEFRNIRVSDLKSNSNLSKIFELSLKNFFEFCPSKGAKNVSRRPRYKLFNFKKNGGTSFIRKRKEYSSSPRTGKMVVKSLVKRVVFGGTMTSVNKRSYVRTFINELRYYRLESWFVRVYPTWVKEFEKEFKRQKIKPKTDPSFLFDLVSGTR